MSDPDWWRGAVFYQIYPRSFLDTNNDGIGDLNGITEKLEYVSGLGVDAIWISPFFKSPMKDFGYDVSDYRDVDPIFGRLEDFNHLLEKAHRLGLKIIIDLVLSHTSNEHPWFSDPDKKDWYVWADTKIDEAGNHAPPNNWVSVFGGSAWEWDERYGQYYLHNFLKEQPDLNFHNQQVQQEMLNICKFWLDQGVDGFRLDVVNFYFHDTALQDNPDRQDGTAFATQFEHNTPYSAQQHIYDKSRPENLAFIEKLRQLTDQYTDRVLIGEIGDDHPYERAYEYTRGLNRLHTSYNTDMMSGIHKELTDLSISTPIETFYALNDSDESAKKEPAWPSWAFSNHDVVRAASRWFKPYDSDPDFSQMLIALLGCLPGSVFLYQGEELGLPEAKIPKAYIQDPWAKETWPEWQGRDGCRTPMPWDDENHCGFSQNTPWLPIPETHFDINIFYQTTQNISVLSFTKKFLNWRKNQIELVKGNYKFINTSNSKIIHLIREHETSETNCIFNLSEARTSYEEHDFLPFGFHIDNFE